jgi:SAM-dependent methyltransferase
MWEYYDRRADQGVRGLRNALDYWTGLGARTSPAEIQAEAAAVQRHLRSLPSGRFLEIGAGPGTFTADLQGCGVALDQSDAALRVLKAGPAMAAPVRGDAIDLPFGVGTFARVFTAHLYGLFPLHDRHRLLREARRVASELVVLDAGRPEGVPAEHWQDRTLPDGGRCRIFRRHFDPGELAQELAGDVIFGGQFYVLVRSTLD